MLGRAMMVKSDVRLDLCRVIERPLSAQGTEWEKPDGSKLQVVAVRSHPDEDDLRVSAAFEREPDDPEAQLMATTFPGLIRFLRTGEYRLVREGDNTIDKIVRESRALRVRDGDVLIVRVDLTMLPWKEAFDRLRSLQERTQEQMPDGIKVFAAPMDMDFTVLTREEIEANELRERSDD